MVYQGASPTVLVALLAAAVFLVRTVDLMLGPLRVALAAAFHTSVPVMGQLAAVINISWGITAPLVGPVSDTYGRRVVGLSGLLLMLLLYIEKLSQITRTIFGWLSSDLLVGFMNLS